MQNQGFSTFGFQNATTHKIWCKYVTPYFVGGGLENMVLESKSAKTLVLHSTTGCITLCWQTTLPADHSYFLFETEAISENQWYFFPMLSIYGWAKDPCQCVK